MSAALVSAASTIDRTCSLAAAARDSLRRRVVAPAPDGEVLLLDALSVQRHWNYLRLGMGEATAA
jgi:hypothetical protein